MPCITGENFVHVIIARTVIVSNGIDIQQLAGRVLVPNGIDIYQLAGRTQN